MSVKSQKQKQKIKCAVCHVDITRAEQCDVDGEIVCLDCYVEIESGI